MKDNKKYIDKVINYIVKNITIDSSADKFHPKGKIFFPWLSFPLSLSTEILSFFDSNDPYNSRPNFHKYCSDNFGLNGKEMKIVLDKLNFIIKNKVKDLYDLPISRFNQLNESIEDKQKKYLIENYVKTEKFKNNVEKLLKQELELLIQEDWIDEESIKEINSVESIVVDEVIRNVGIFDLVVFITLNIGNNGSRYIPIYNNYGGIINYLGDKIREIIPNLKVNFKINYIDNQLSEQIESNSDKQTKFLKKVVDRMMEETVPYNLSKGSVITPFVADKNSNGKYVLSANYCKNMVDYFDDQFRLGKIFNDYLKMFGLSYEEMEEVMYWYFNDVYEKYFSRFFDDSYKTRPRLDEGIDLGFVDKVADSVLREIVWDFDRGLVYFPMIDYSASIRDDDFLSAVSADDPFSNRFSGDTRWHIDLMKHIEDTYGITGNEWGRVWGSLQGEIWEKTDNYWDSFTRGY